MTKINLMKGEWKEINTNGKIIQNTGYFDVFITISESTPTGIDGIKIKRNEMLNTYPFVGKIWGLCISENSTIEIIDIPGFNIGNDYYLDIARERYTNFTSFEGFGENPEITTASDPEDIWDSGGLYTFSSSANINKIASSNNSDTQDIIIYGLDENWQSITQTITLTGQIPVELSTPLIRINKMINMGVSNIAGDVYLALSTTTWTDGIPDNSNDIRAKLRNGNNETLMCVFSVPAEKKAYFYGGYVAASTSGVVGQSAVLTWRARPFGGVFQVKSKLAITGNGNSTWQYKYSIPVKLSAKTDIVIRCEEVSATMGVVGGFTVLLIDD